MINKHNYKMYSGYIRFILKSHMELLNAITDPYFSEMDLYYKVYEGYYKDLKMLSSKTGLTYKQIIEIANIRQEG